MHGHARTVEHRIRLWVVQQERNRRKERQPNRVNANVATPVEQRQRAVETRKREHWR